MPLLMAKRGEPHKIVSVRGKEETVRYLESMGFVPGAVITVVSEFNGNLIVNVKDARVALDRSMASKIMI